jgi:ketosteroid isomerase-like protein
MMINDRTAQTNQFLDLLETGDRKAIAGMLDADVVWSVPMTTSEEPARGLQAFGSRLGSISALMRSARFLDRRVTASLDGATTFVQTRGDFLTTDGRPYRNVYVFRFDWRGDQIVSWEEYANPLTILRTFPGEYRELLHQLTAELGGD